MPILACQASGSGQRGESTKEKAKNQATSQDDSGSKVAVKPGRQLCKLVNARRNPSRVILKAMVAMAMVSISSAQTQDYRIKIVKILPSGWSLPVCYTSCTSLRILTIIANRLKQNGM